ncbi:hypothetical protein MTR67_022919 [Solanum verrucosum]|uniref:Uncharacterized protein n=1 Tax=Solanum verrucosum TaxID=315347 RepID=A0AAF0QSJ9_SOLVR|nr:hypothetical protein MTR67_022919 [Solanum verrucosum]
MHHASLLLMHQGNLVYMSATTPFLTWS